MMHQIRTVFLLLLGLTSMFIAPVTEALNLNVLEVCNYTVTNCTASDNFYGNRVVAAPGQTVEYKFFYSGTTSERLEFTLPSGLTYLETVIGTAPSISADGQLLTYTGGNILFGTFRARVEANAPIGTQNDNFLSFYPGSGAGTPAESSPEVEVLITNQPLPMAAMTIDSNHDGSIDGYELLFVTPVQDATFTASAVQIGNRTVTPIELCPARFASYPACQTANDHRVIIGFQDGVYTDTQVKPDLILQAGSFANVPAISSAFLQETDHARPIVRTSGPLTTTSTGSIEITFSESMNPATVTNATVQLQPAIPFTITMVGDNNTTARITPTTPFTQGNYTLTFLEVATDFAGNPLVATTALPVTITDIAVLAPAPTLQAGTITTTSIEVRWTPVTGATGYQVTLRDTVTGTDIVRAVTGTSTTFTGLVSGRAYSATVYAVNTAQAMISQISAPLSISTNTTSGGGGGGGSSSGGGGGGSYGGATCPYSINGNPYVMPVQGSTLVSQIQEHVLLPSQTDVLGTFTRAITLVNCSNNALKAEIARNTVVTIDEKPTATTLRAPYQVSHRQLQKGISFPSNMAGDNIYVFGTLQERFSLPVQLHLTVPTNTTQGTTAAPLTLVSYDISTNTWKTHPVTSTLRSGQAIELTTQASTIVGFTLGTPQRTTTPSTPGQDRPTNLDASALNGYVLISWKDPRGNLQHIEMYRKVKGEEFSTTPLATIAPKTEFYFDTTVTPYQEYTYRLRAVFQDGTFSPWSEEITIIVDEAGTIIHECIPALAFRDTLRHWSHDYVNFLRLRCIVSGKQPGIFAGDHSITRAELTKLVIHAYGHAYKLETLPESQAFSDIDMNAWYPAYIALAKKEGIVHGYGDGLFRPDQVVNRAEAMKIITNASGEAYGSQTIARSFADTENNAWYLPFVEFAARQGIVEGYPSEAGTRVFRPGQAISRSEVAKIIALFIQRGN